MNRAKIEVALLLTVIACFSFILGIYFKPSYFNKKSEQTSLDNRAPIIQNLSAPQSPPQGEILQPVNEKDLSGPSPDTTVPKISDTNPLDHTTLSSAPSTSPFNVTKVLGFIKEVKSDSLVLDFLTAQFPAPEEKSLQREFLVSGDSMILVLKAQPESAVPADSTKPTTGQTPKIVNAEDGELVMEKLTLSPATLQDLKVGDYALVVSDFDLNNNTITKIKEIKIYPLKDNPYLKGEFTTYWGLPTESDFALLGN